MPTTTEEYRLELYEEIKYNIHQVEEALASLIDATPTGKLREKLTEANIYIGLAKERIDDSKV